MEILVEILLWLLGEALWQSIFEVLLAVIRTLWGLLVGEDVEPPPERRRRLAWVLGGAVAGALSVALHAERIAPQLGARLVAMMLLPILAGYAAKAVAVLRTPDPETRERAFFHGLAFGVGYVFARAAVGWVVRAAASS